jgi:hypothetical protein
LAAAHYIFINPTKTALTIDRWQGERKKQTFKKKNAESQ